MNGARQEGLLLQRREPVHQVGDFGIVRRREEERAKGLRFRHEPETHAGDDSKIRLRKNSVEERPDSIAKHPSGARFFEVAKSRFEHPAVREHDLQATERLEVIAVASVPEASIERVPHEACFRACPG